VSTAIIEGDLAVGHVLRPLDIPDMTLPEFVLAQAAGAGASKP
jgi:hypothetical protein